MVVGRCKKSIFELFAGILEDSVDGAKSRDVAIYTRLHGLDGGEAESLRKTAARYNLSSERVRQICDNIGGFELVALRSTRGYRDLEKRLSAAVDLIGTMIPSTDAAVSEHLVEMGLLNEGELASSLIRIGDLIALNRGIRIDDWSGVTAFDWMERPRCFKSLLTHARKIASASGAFGVEMLCESFSRAKQIDLEPEDVKSMVAPFATQVPITPAGTEAWFYFPNASSDAINRARNRIGSFGFCSLSQLSAIDSSNTRSRYGYRIPEEVLATVLVAAGFIVDGDRAYFGKSTAGRAKLSPVQEEMVSIMLGLTMKHGGEVKQTDFITACEAKGINASTVRAYLYRSGIFRRSAGKCELAP